MPTVARLEEPSDLSDREVIRRPHLSKRIPFISPGFYLLCCEGARDHAPQVPLDLTDQQKGTG
jgi:hypothetical protein